MKQRSTSEIRELRNKNIVLFKYLIIENGMAKVIYPLNMSISFLIN